jgi:hypothetical protein
MIPLVNEAVYLFTSHKASAVPNINSLFFNKILAMASQISFI